MESFFLFDVVEEELRFHVEYCSERAVHTADGVVVELSRLLTLAGVETKEDLLRYLVKNYSVGNGFFTFLKDNDVPFTLTEKSYVDTSSDV